MYVSAIRTDSVAQIDPVLSRMRHLVEQSAPLNSAVLRAVHHHLAAPGQGIRGKMALQAALCMGMDAQTAIPLAACCDLLHNASLIHDDLSDGDTERRGIPTVWSVYGRDVALCAGDLLISCAYLALSDLPQSALIGALLRRVHAHVARTIHGQAADLLPAAAGCDPIAAYLATAGAKSGPLLCLPLDLAFTLCGDHTARDLSRDAIMACALAYQMADDLDDVASDERTEQGAAANIVIVLQRSLGCNRATALQRATVMARNHLTQACRLAAALPNGTDAIVRELARRIDLKLNGN